MRKLDQDTLDCYIKEYYYMRASELSRLILEEENNPDLTLESVRHKVRRARKKVGKLGVAESGESRVLVIGDLHEPFCLDGYLEFCIDTYKKFQCNKVIFIGDVIDNHYSSYHETDADAMGGGDELDLSISKIAAWYCQFPDAKVCIGNHDRIIMRKAQSGAIPKKWIKNYKEVLETPGWDFVESVEVDDVLYVHGEGGNAKGKMKANMQSVVCGHSHTLAFVEWGVGTKYKVFGMQVGCGINHESYAMAYAKNFKKPAIGCGVIVDGKLAFNVMMDL